MRAVFCGCVASVTTATLLGGPAIAQVKVDVSKITCEQWLNFEVADFDEIAFWLSGFYNGKNGNLVLDVKAQKDAIDRVKRECYRAAETPVMQVIEREMKVER
jgi:acid stress chaperone HdeB